MNGAAAREPPMRPAHEDVRLALKSALPQELMSCLLEVELGLLANEMEIVEEVDAASHPAHISALIFSKKHATTSGVVLDIGTDAQLGPQDDSTRRRLRMTANAI